MLIEEQIHRFDHERIPERVVHARGAAAHGHFKLFESASDVTSAGVLTDTSRTTPVFLRFSTVQGSRGSADTVRDVRGFAVKFYTDEGNWDIVGNDIPVFFIQESIKFPDIVHAVKPEPHNEVPQGQSAHNNFWDFVYLNKESTHMYHWNMSDRGIPRSYRMIQGFGVNTYSLINAEGKRVFVKFIFTPELGVHSLVWDEALKLAGQDPDFHRKDLYEAIENGAFPKWKFGIQVIKDEDQDKFPFDIFDATKLWPEEDVPIRYIGELELNRNVDEYFTETEQVAFCTSHIVPGIDFSPDPLLQGRNFSYQDTQLSRLGINWEELPINRPVCPYMNFNRDGQGRHTITKGQVNYWPNRFTANPPANHTGAKDGFKSFPAPEFGVKSRSLPSGPKWSDYLSHAQLFYNSLSPIEKLHMTNAFSFELDHCEDPTVYTRIVDRLTEIDLSLAQAVAEKCGAPTPTEAKAKNHGRKAKGLSQLEYMPAEPTIASRRIAILIADGYDHASYSAIVSAIQSQMALPFTIAPKRQPCTASNGKDTAQPTSHFNGMRSTMFDAVIVPDGSPDSIKTLITNGLSRFWVREAFGHDKAVAGVGEGVKLVQAAIAEAEGYQVVENAAQGDGVKEWYGVVTGGAKAKLSTDFKITQDGQGLLEQFFFGVSQHRCWARELDGYASMVSI